MKIMTIGLEPDLKLVERLTFLQEDLGKILTARGADSRWVRPEFMHMPLLCLGRQDDDEIPEISHLLSATLADMSSFLVSIAGISACPSPDCPRIIQVGVDAGRDRIMELHDKVKNAFAAANFPYDARPFNPAIMLGRTVTNGGRVDITDAVDAIHDLNFGQSEVFELALYGANLLENRSTHQVLARCAFGACPH